MGERLIGPTKYFAFLNGERSYQALGDCTPDVQCIQVGLAVVQ